jgi:hypothetical protein
LIAGSTPYGATGWFYQEWTAGTDWARWEIAATECPRLPAAFLADQQRQMGQWWFAQEFLCQFQASQGAVFRPRDIQAIVRPEWETWDLLSRSA